jgi:hypothetical protein
MKRVVRNDDDGPTRALAGEVDGAASGGTHEGISDRLLARTWVDRKMLN